MFFKLFIMFWLFHILFQEESLRKSYQLIGFDDLGYKGNMYSLWNKSLC